MKRYGWNLVWGSKGKKNIVEKETEEKREIGLRNSIHHMLHPIQGGQGLQADQEYLTPKFYQAVQVDRGILGARDHLTEKTQQSFIYSLHYF